MRRSIVTLLVSFAWLEASAGSARVVSTHPRIWLTPSLQASLKEKVSSKNPDWIQVKASADELLKQPVPHFTVTGATNANPVQFTLAEPISWTGSVPVFIAGGSGTWAAVNSAGGDRPRPLPATRTGRNTFTVPIDSSAFGEFAGQHLVLFLHDGNLSAYGYQGSGWQTTLQTLGLAYQITGNRAYAAKGIELLKYISSLGAAGMLAPASIDSGFPSRSAVFGVALAYDWFYDQLGPEDRAAAVQAVNAWYDWFTRAAFEKSGPAYGNYFGGHILGFGLAGYATASENPRSAEIVSHIRALFDANVPAAFETGGFAGGYPLEAYVYGTNHFQRLLFYMLAVKSATGEDLLAGTDYARKIARSLLYNLKPNRWQTSDEGDFAGEFTGILQPGLPIVLSHVLAGTPEGAWMQFLTQHMAPEPYGGREDDPFVRFLFYDRSRPAIDHRLALPTSYSSPGDGHTYWRSSWQDDAVWTSLMAGSTHWAEHQARSAGHVSIQRGNDYLLVNSGQWKGADGVTGQPQVSDNRSWRANTLFVNDGGDYLFTGDNYVGGQGFWGKNAVLAAEGNTDFAYAKADLTSAYSLGDRKPYETRSVRYFYRNFVALGSGIVVLFDRVRLLKDSYTARLYFHVNSSGGAPAVARDSASIRVGKSVLFLKTLLPGGVQLQQATDPVSPGDPRPSTYRLEVSNPTPSTQLDALDVLIAIGASIRTMPSTSLIESSGRSMVGAAIADDDVFRIVLFAADGRPQSSASYDIPEPATRRSFHVVADLQPGTRYDVLQNGTNLTSVAASAQGVVSFRSEGGRQFTLARESPAGGRSARH